MRVKLPVFMVILATMACQLVSSPQPPTPISPTATPSLSVTTLPDSDGLTATVNELPFPRARVARSLLLSEGHSASCQLPCWHGLEIGVATEQDIQREMGDTFEATEGFDFFPPPDIEGGFSERFLVDGTFVGGYYWYIEMEERLGSYFMFAYIDGKTGRLLGIQETIDSFETFELPSLKDIVDKVGHPKWIYGSRAASTYSVILYYPEGIIVEVVLLLHREADMTTTDNACLNDKPLSVIISLVDSYTESGEARDSLLHSYWGRPQHPAPYIDETLGESIEAFLEFLNSENPCIEVTL